MPLLSCPSGPQAIWCPRSTDDILPAVLGLLPPGPAWEAAHIDGTVQNSFWRAFANVLGFTYGRMCDFVDEFFCQSVKESRDQWIAEYGLDDTCDPYGHNLCVKVAAQGGSTCDYFVDMAALSGWSITCETPDIPEPVAGCFEVGCTPLGPTPVFMPYGSRIGYGQRGACDYGEVVHHPDPDKWENGKTSGASCAVPGSNLGFGPDADESCCFIVGYYDFAPTAGEAASDYCRPESNTVSFDCPQTGVTSDKTPCATDREVGWYDETHNYTDWGHAFVWNVVVDIAASSAAEGSDASIAAQPDDSPLSAAGCFIAGDTPLCANTTSAPDQPAFVLCFLDRIKPAHTTLNVKVLQP